MEVCDEVRTGRRSTAAGFWRRCWCAAVLLRAPGGCRRGRRARSWRQRISARWAAKAAVGSCCSRRGVLCLLLLPEWVLQVELWMEMVLERVGSEMALGPAALSGELHVVALVVFCSWVSGGDGFRWRWVSVRGCPKGVGRSAIALRRRRPWPCWFWMVVWSCFSSGRAEGGCWSVCPWPCKAQLFCNVRFTMARCCGGGGAILHR